MREMSVAEQRYKAVLAVIAEGRTVTEVARDWGVSRQTMHAWLAKYEDEGLEGLSNRSHRRAHSPHQLSAVWEEKVLEVRRAKPYWGARRLALELTRIAVISLDVVLHLRNREALFGEVARVLIPGGRFWFTDAAIVTGPLSSHEVELRRPRGYTQFAPPVCNERAIERSRLKLVQVEDQTDDLLENVTGRITARFAHRAELEAVEGVDGFGREQRYLETVAALATRRALSRFAFVAECS